MKDRFYKFQVGLLFGLAISVLILFSAILLWEKLYPLPYRISQPVTQFASTPADTGELTARVENLENDQNFNLKALEWKLDQKLIIIGGVAFFISLAAGVVGIKSYNDLDKVVQEKVGREVDKALYQLDPTNLSIFVPELDNPQNKHEMEKVWDRLDLTGLNNLNWYRGFESGRVKRLFNGVTIVLVQSKEDEGKLVAFLKRHKKQLDPRRAAFILYAKGYQVSSETLEAYENLVTANMPVTVANMVLVVGRGLSSAFPSKKEETK